MLQNGNLERDARSLSWLMVGQLVAVTICDGYEPRFREDYDESDTTNTETEFQTTTTEDDTDNEELRFLQNRRNSTSRAIN